MKNIKALNLLSIQEYKKLVKDFNNTYTNYPKDKCVHTIFEEQVSNKPKKIAVIASDKTLTYEELNNQSNRIANALLDRGIKSNDIVGFKLTRKSYLLSVMIGILKSGAAYMPIDIECPKDRLEYIINDCGAKFLITEENITELINHYNIQNPKINSNSEDICYCIYTSGSTGKPKGALVQHYSVVNFCMNYTITNALKMISTTTVTFDAFAEESINVLLSGDTIILANESQSKIQYELEELVVKNKGECLVTTPSKMKTLILDNNYVNYLKGLKVIDLGGEKLDEELINKLRKLSTAKIYNSYGPTETTVAITKHHIKNPIITIGKPIANSQVYIVDKFLNPLPVGITGELCIAGDCVGVGYINRPKLTSEKFIKNPFGKGKMYKTGDLAYWNEEGNIVYVGRNDFQVKIRGLRIELEEIENVICQIKEVEQTVVVVRKDDTGRQLICAFYKEKKEVDLEEIKRNIKTKLPKYMMPHIFVKLEEMPLTSSGKINRKALPKIDLTCIDNTVEYVRPVSELEKKLVDLMEQILNTYPIGLNNDFFECGGDSLKAIEFIAKAHNEGIYLNLQNIFDYSNVSDLCKFINNKDKSGEKYIFHDFKIYDKLIKKNRIENLKLPQKQKIGNLLLTGATGFLGIHILAEYLEVEKGDIYCLVRGDEKTAKKRIYELLNYYFGDKYANCNRIKIIYGDITKPIICDANIDMIIHSAATVKHYGSYEYFYDINVEGTKNIIKLAFEKHAKLIHISTLSVSGTNFVNDTSIVNKGEKIFNESNLYIGQNLDNVYVRSKFEAEKIVLDAQLNGLEVNICRMGNLTNRKYDGQFQYNYKTNAFVKRIRGILELGKLPEYLLNLKIEFTPVDYAAKSIINISKYFNNNATIFHIANDNPITMKQLVVHAKKLGIDVQFVKEDEFYNSIYITENNPKTSHIFESFINDMDKDGRLVYESDISIENNFTNEYLRKIDFDWCEIDYEYIKKWLEYFINIGYIKI